MSDKRSDKELYDALSIGSIVGGSNERNARWQAWIRILTRRVARLTESVFSPLKLNVVYHVPGQILVPEHEGLRTGRYSKKSSGLMIQVALPEEVPDDVEGYLIQTLYDAIDEAERFARKRRVADNLDALRALVANVAAEEGWE